MFADPAYTWNGNRYSLDFKFDKMQDVLGFVYPGLYIEDNTTLNIKINDKGRMAGSLDSRRIALGLQYLKELSFDFNNNDGNFTGELYSQEMEVAKMKMSDNSFRILADDDHIGLDALAFQLQCCLTGIAAEKFRIFDAIALCVIPGVLHSLGDHFHADDLAGCGGHSQRDGADTAVKIQNRIVLGDPVSYTHLTLPTILLV